MTRWQRHAGALWRRSSDRVLVLPEGRDDLLLLEGIGAAVWLLLEEATTVVELTEALLASSAPLETAQGEEATNVPPRPADAARELSSFLVDLAEVRAVTEADVEVAR